jgi:hypothetical protein
MALSTWSLAIFNNQLNVKKWGITQEVVKMRRPNVCIIHLWPDDQKSLENKRQPDSIDKQWTVAQPGDCAFIDQM